MPVTSIPQPDKAVTVVNARGAGPLVILCEHASHHIPARYAGLGLARSDRTSHAVWDPGALAVAQALSDMHDAPLIAGEVSRLVYDCNRPPNATSAMPARSETIEVPGNQGLTPDDRVEREISIYRPFCDAVARVLDARRNAAHGTVLVTVHSFTPVYFGTPRDVEVGIVHDEDRRIADVMLSHADKLPHRPIGRNEPYGPADGVTHSLRIHGLARALPNVMLEIRNDLLTTPAGQTALAGEINALLAPALAALGLPQKAAHNA